MVEISFQLTSERNEWESLFTDKQGKISGPQRSGNLRSNLFSHLLLCRFGGLITSLDFCVRIMTFQGEDCGWVGQWGKRVEKGRIILTVPTSWDSSEELMKSTAYMCFKKHIASDMFLDGTRTVLLVV